MKSYENNFKKSDNSFEKQQKLNVARQEVEHLIDKLGKGIDEEIKETVVILRAMEYPTSSSCAGHTEEDGYAPPYVEIYAKEPEGWKEDKAKADLWKEENLKHRNRLTPLLAQFYKERVVPWDAHLYLSSIGMIGGFRLETVGTKMRAEELGVASKQEIFDKIRSYQKEMREFSVFLKELFLKSAT